MTFLPESTPPSQSRLRGLKGSISAPVSVARGTVLTYQVTLRNPGQAPVAFSPCPSYTEFLGIGGSPSHVVQSFLLNCAAGASIGAGSSLTYQMKLSVPSIFPTGPTKLAWKLDPDGPGVGTAIRVT